MHIHLHQDNLYLAVLVLLTALHQVYYEMLIIVTLYSSTNAKYKRDSCLSMHCFILVFMYLPTIETLL